MTLLKREIHYEDIIGCPFCNKQITMSESCSIFKNTEQGLKTFIGCRECQATETLPYDHEEHFF